MAALPACRYRYCRARCWPRSLLADITAGRARFWPSSLLVELAAGQASCWPSSLLSSLNKEDLSYNRPITNVSFISKLTEYIVKNRLHDHLISNSLFNPFQSAYIKFYYTEATLLSLHDHLLMPFLCNKSPAFVFLIYLLPLILSTTPSYSIVFLPGLAFPLFHYNGSLHISHPAHLL